MRGAICGNATGILHDLGRFRAMGRNGLIWLRLDGFDIRRVSLAVLYRLQIHVASWQALVLVFVKNRLLFRRKAGRRCLG